MKNLEIKNSLSNKVKGNCIVFILNSWGRYSLYCLEYNEQHNLSMAKKNCILTLMFFNLVNNYAWGILTHYYRKPLGHIFVISLAC